MGAEVLQVAGSEPGGRVRSSAVSPLLPIVAVVEIKSDGSWKGLEP